MQDSDLDDLLAAARADRPTPSPALMARVIADADRLQPRPALRAAPAARSRPGFLAVLAEAFGGRGALAGMAAATLAGVWVGAAQPAAFSVLTAGVWPTESVSVELIPDLFAVLDPEG